MLSQFVGDAEACLRWLSYLVSWQSEIYILNKQQEVEKIYFSFKKIKK